VARELRVVISGDASPLSRSLGKASRDADTFGAKLGHLAGTGLKALGFGAVGAGVAVGVGMKKALDATGNFQESLNVLKSTTNATNGQMAQASKLAIALGKDAKLPAVSAGDAATAMLELGRDGDTATESMKSARGALLLVTAAQTDVATSSKVITQNLHAFNLGASHTNQIVDEMAGFMNATGTDFTAFADSLTYTASISHTVGQGFDDLSTELAILSQNGLEGSMAGTGLRTILTSLGSEGSKASGMLKKLGVSTVDQSGNFIGMHAVLEKLQPKLDGMTRSERLHFLQLAFGKPAMNAANILLDTMASKYDKTKAAIDRKGQADKLAAAHMKGYNGALAQLSSALETLQINIGQKVMPVATRFAKFLTAVASAPNLSVAVKIAVSGIESVGGDIKKSIGDALFGSSRTIVVGSAEGGATKVVVSQGIISQLEDFNWQKYLFGSKKTMVIGAAEGGGTSRVTVDPGLVGQIGTAFQSAVGSVNWTSVGQAVGAAISRSITFTSSAFDKIANIAMDWANSHAGQIAEVGLVIGLNMISKMLDPTFWMQHWQLIGGVMLSVAMTAFPEGRLAEIGGKVAQLMFGTFGKLIRPLLRDALLTLPEAIGAPLARLSTALGSGIEAAGSRAVKAAIDLTVTVVNTFSRQFGKLGPLVKVLINTAIVGEIGKAAGAAYAAAVSLAERIADGIKTAPAKLEGMAGDLASKLVSVASQVAGSAYDEFVSLGSHLIDGIAAGVQAKAGSLARTVVDVVSGAWLAGKVANKIKSPSQLWADTIGSPLIQGVVQGITREAPGLKTQVVQAIRGAMAGARSQAMTDAGDLGATIGNAISAQAASQIAALDNSPLGQQLALITQQIQARQDSQQYQSLLDAITSASATGDPAQVQQAQRALDDWLMQQQATQLAAQLQAQKDNIQQTSDAKATAVQNDLNNLLDSFNRGLISEKVYNAQLQKILSDSGEDYKTIGSTLGSSFANGFRDSLKDLANQIAAIITGPSAQLGISIGGGLGGKAVTSIGGGGLGGSIHGFADGALIKGGRGGVLGLIGEGPKDELITPLDSLGSSGIGGGGDTYNFYGVLDADDAARKITQLLITHKRRGNNALVQAI
jgi:TP901 family phage tail tape measure protein